MGLDKRYKERIISMTTQLERIENELKLAGYKLNPVKDTFESDDDYSQSIGTCAYEICKMFYNQDHSGFSAKCTLRLLQRLLVEEGTLTPLTNDPTEWDKHDYGDGEVSYQSKRNFSCFSDDNLKTYYDIEAEENRDFELDDNGKRTGWSSLKPAAQRVRHELKSREEVLQELKGN